MTRTRSLSLVLHALLIALVLVFPGTPTLADDGDSSPAVPVDGGAGEATGTEDGIPSGDPPAGHGAWRGRPGSDAGSMEPTGSDARAVDDDDAEPPGAVQLTTGAASTGSGGISDPEGSFGSENQVGGPSENGQGKSPHDAGSKGAADDMNPPGQSTTDDDRGYECDGNVGIGQGNPAHSRCAADDDDDDDGDEPDVVVQKSGPSRVAVGDTFEYRLIVRNVGGAHALEVTLRDEVPAGLTAVSATPDRGSCAVDGRVVVCEFDRLAEDGGHVVVTVRVRATVSACPQVVNRATVTASNEPDGREDDNRSRDVATQVTGCDDDDGDGRGDDDEPDVVIEKRVQPASVVQPGGLLTYTLIIENVGDEVARNVTVTDELESGVIAAPPTTSTGQCSLDRREGGDRITCDLGSLDPGERATVTFIATPSGGTCEIRNQASVAATNEPVSLRGDNTSREVMVTVACPGDIDLEKEATPSFVRLDPDGGGPRTITYRYTVTNEGEAPLSDLALVDDVLGAVTVPVEVLQPGESVTVRAKYTLTDADVERSSVTNVATVRGTTPTGDTVTDRDTEVVEVVSILPDLFERPPPGPRPPDVGPPAPPPPPPPPATEPADEPTVRSHPPTGVPVTALLAFATLSIALGSALRTRGGRRHPRRSP